MRLRKAKITIIAILSLLPFLGLIAYIVVTDNGNRNPKDDLTFQSVQQLTYTEKAKTTAKIEVTPKELQPVATCKLRINNATTTSVSGFLTRFNNNLVVNNKLGIYIIDSIAQLTNINDVIEPVKSVFSSNDIETPNSTSEYDSIIIPYSANRFSNWFPDETIKNELLEPYDELIGIRCDNKHSIVICKNNTSILFHYKFGRQTRDGSLDITATEPLRYYHDSICFDTTGSESFYYNLNLRCKTMILRSSAVVYNYPRDLIYVISKDKVRSYSLDGLIHEAIELNNNWKIGDTLIANDEEYIYCSISEDVEEYIQYNKSNSKILRISFSPDEEKDYVVELLYENVNLPIVGSMEIFEDTLFVLDNELFSLSLN